MPNFDRICPSCETVLRDCLEPSTPPTVMCKCGQPTQRVWLPSSAPAVLGDEIDIEIKHGLCHADGTPRRFRSREELKRAEQASGYMNYVEHKGTKGGDKSPHTSRWI